jgi:hypothetical protein
VLLVGCSDVGGEKRKRRGTRCLTIFVHKFRWLSFSFLYASFYRLAVLETEFFLLNRIFIHAYYKE